MKQFPSFQSVTMTSDYLPQKSNGFFFAWSKNHSAKGYGIILGLWRGNKIGNRWAEFKTEHVTRMKLSNKIKKGLTANSTPQKSVTHRLFSKYNMHWFLKMNTRRKKTVHKNIFKKPITLCKFYSSKRLPFKELHIFTNQTAICFF